MSGGVGPCGEIGLPKEQEQPEHRETHLLKKPHVRRGFITFRQLQVLALLVVLSASGLVSPEDFAFVLLSLIYTYFLSKVAFPSLGPSTAPPVFGEDNRALGLYVLAGAIIGLYLPIAYISEGIYVGDKDGIKAAAPHLFLLATQVFMEQLTFSDSFSIPIRVFVPVLYNSRRIFAISDWLWSELSRVDKGYGGSARRLYVGKALAVANMAFWCFNLFGFLLPVYFPKAFKLYYYNKYKAQD